MTKRLNIVGTAYRRMLVWDGHYHEIRVRILDQNDPDGTRWRTQGAVQHAAGFAGIRRLTNVAARRRRWHYFPVKRRLLARRFMVEIEPLVKARLVAVELDGERVRVRRTAAQ